MFLTFIFYIFFVLKNLHLKIEMKKKKELKTTCPLHYENNNVLYTNSGDERESDWFV